MLLNGKPKLATHQAHQYSENWKKKNKNNKKQGEKIKLSWLSPSTFDYSNYKIKDIAMLAEADGWMN